jgi:hypothetical protein
VKLNKTRLAAQIGIALAGMIALDASAQVLLNENFSVAGNDCATGPFNGFPTGWTRFNVDNRTPNAAVSYVTDAFVDREDFKFAAGTGDCAAFSTSWYSPAGASNDFMCTPPVGPLPAGTDLSWRAVAYDASYPDGYEVRIMTTAPTGGPGSIGNLLTASTSVFSVPAEATAWTPHTVSLAAYAGQSVYACFRNPSNDQFLLLIDDVKIASTAVDLRVSQPAPPTEYKRVPFWNGQPIKRSATVANAGGQNTTNVVLQADTQLDLASVEMGTSTPPVPLAIGASQTFSVTGTRKIDAVGSWRVHYGLAFDQSATEAAPGDNVADSTTVVANTDELARDDGVTTASVGIAGGSGELGQQFDLPTGARLHAIRYVLSNVAGPYPGGPVVAHLRAYDQMTSKPGATIATTNPFNATATGGIVDADFPSGPINLAPGRYVATVEQPAGVPLALAQTATIFTAGTQWLDWPTNPAGTWVNAETVGAQYALPFRISLVFDVQVFADGFENVGPTQPATADRATSVPNAAADRTVRNPARWNLIPAH